MAKASADYARLLLWAPLYVVSQVGILTAPKMLFKKLIIYKGLVNRARGGRIMSLFKEGPIVIIRCLQEDG